MRFVSNFSSYEGHTYEPDPDCHVVVLVEGAVMMPGSPLIWIACISIALNAVLGWAYLGQRDDTTEAKTALRDMQGQRDGAREAASACSDAVDDLRTLADQRAQEADAARAQARKAAAGRNARADAILSAPPAVPGDDCASARVRVDQWLKGRAAP